MDFKPMHYLYTPSGDDSAFTLLLLHGTGGDERDLIPLASYFGHGINILSLRGNVEEQGMPRFFRRLGMGIFDEKDLEFRTLEMVEFLKELSRKEGFDISKLVALGYSNGANIAGATLVSYPDFLAGAILFRPMQPFRNNELLPSKHKVPVFISTGKNDPTIQAQDTENYISLLKNAGFEITAHELATGHNLTQTDLDLASDWFLSNFKS